MTVSGIEAPPSTRLFNLWIEQKIGDGLGLRLGQFSAAQEFLTSDNANLFINSTFGWPMAAAQDLPSGGPAYPEATPGARLAWTPSDQFTIRAAIFNGDPAGPGPGNPVQRDPSGLAFRVNDPPFVIVESGYGWGDKSAAAPPASGNPNQEGTDIGARHRRLGAGPGVDLAGSLKLGAWIHTGSFADQRIDAQGGPLAASGGLPRQHRGNLAAYAVLDQELWRVPGQGGRGLSGFLRISASPSDRNQVGLYADGGFTFKGPLASRPDDLIGLGVAWGDFSADPGSRSRSRCPDGTGNSDPRLRAGPGTHLSMGGRDQLDGSARLAGDFASGWPCGHVGGRIRGARAFCELSDSGCTCVGAQDDHEILDRRANRRGWFQLIRPAGPGTRRSRKRQRRDPSTDHALGLRPSTDTFAVVCSDGQITSVRPVATAIRCWPLLS